MSVAYAKNEETAVCTVCTVESRISSSETMSYRMKVPQHGPLLHNNIVLLVSVQFV